MRSFLSYTVNSLSCTRAHAYLLLFILASSVFVSSAFAQDAEKKRINAIKLDPEYIGSEATNISKDSAFVEACQALALSINSEKDRGIQYEQLVPIVQSISHKRGENHRVFVYIKRSEIPAQGTPIAKATPKVAKKKEAATVTEKKEEVAATEKGATVTATEKEAPPATSASTSEAHYNEVLMHVAECETISEAVRYLKAFKQQGKLQEYGGLKDTNREALAGSYLLVYKDDVVVAILTPIQDGSRTNVRTGKEDKTSNYSTCGAVWFR